ncbi:D-dopachrome decarboxylase [Platysternon megacephalum]|uniref:D-dopachrome decarboxylase n=1 Tax=Platysternon megacephalum TaxID=55544 RepID=A0A4D9F4A2_9SAUR|nr:D-dopachrome decarboxylase [Platysternon megacephalum]
MKFEGVMMSGHAGLTMEKHLTMTVLYSNGSPLGAKATRRHESLPPRPQRSNPKRARPGEAPSEALIGRDACPICPLLSRTAAKLSPLRYPPPAPQYAASLGGRNRKSRRAPSSSAPR